MVTFWTYAGESGTTLNFWMADCNLYVIKYWMENCDCNLHVFNYFEWRTVIASYWNFEEKCAYKLLLLNFFRRKLMRLQAFWNFDEDSVCWLKNVLNYGAVETKLVFFSCFWKMRVLGLLMSWWELVSYMIDLIHDILSLFGLFWGVAKKEQWPHTRHTHQKTWVTVSQVSRLEAFLSELSPLLLSQTHVVGAQKNHLDETILLSTHSICFV